MLINFIVNVNRRKMFPLGFWCESVLLLAAATAAGRWWKMEKLRYRVIRAIANSRFSFSVNKRRMRRLSCNFVFWLKIRVIVYLFLKRYLYRKCYSSFSFDIQMKLYITLRRPRNGYPIFSFCITTGLQLYCIAHSCSQMCYVTCRILFGVLRIITTDLENAKSRALFGSSAKN